MSTARKPRNTASPPTSKADEILDDAEDWETLLDFAEEYRQGRLETVSLEDVKAQLGRG